MKCSNLDCQKEITSKPCFRHSKVLCKRCYNRERETRWANKKHWDNWMNGKEVAQ